MNRHRQPSRTATQPEQDEVASATTRVQPPADGSRLPALLWLVAAFIAIALIKPWGGSGRISPTLRPDLAPPPTPTPAPTKDRSAAGLAEPVCLGAGAWRVATLETWRDRDVRVWRAIEPVAEASGPLDPVIPSVGVVADALSGLGWCAPAFGDDQPVGPARVRVWQVVHGAARVVAVRQVQPADGVTPMAALYLPASGGWTSGLVVFEYRDAGTGAVEWFAADLRITGPSPSGSATAAPSSTSP